ncbi:MAG TPA: metallophosphoesterase [Vicinamibacteria bacterium]
MRTLAHLSDLHFGSEDPEVVAGLLEDLRAEAPSLVVVSGDLTQRARRAQFRAARAFLEALPAPWLSVPGNHDIPLFDLARRMLSPLGRYRRFVGHEDQAWFRDEALAVVGLNTARADRWKHGRVEEEQAETLRRRLRALPDEVFKVVVTHHPFVPPPREDAPPIVDGAAHALAAAEACGVDLMLAGHLHEGYTADVRDHHLLRRSILVAQAGTATSHRRRMEPNAYNLIAVEPARVRFDVRRWTGEAFTVHQSTLYLRNGERWQRAH